MFGKVDILICNAGIMGSKPLADVFFDDHINSNVKEPLFWSRLSRHFFHSVCFVLFIQPIADFPIITAILPNALVHVASKGALEQVNRVLAKDLGTGRIAVNMVSPGFVDTDLFHVGKPDAVINAIATQNPSNSLGQSEGIAPIVAFLSSPAAQ